MAARIRYMGNKHGIAPDVARIVSEAFHRQRPFLDLFCGMCLVGGAISHSGRRVWGNDVQRFAALVAECLLANPQRPPDAKETASALLAPFTQNRMALSDRFGEDLAVEQRVIQRPSLSSYRRAHDSWRHAGNDDRLAMEVTELRAAPTSFPYRLASLTFAWGYLGIEQAIALDSIRFALDAAELEARLTPAQVSWGRLALLQACSVMASTPGHFAQYLRAATNESLIRIIRQRKRDAWAQFLHELSLLSPYGSARWRARNVVFQEIRAREPRTRSLPE